MTVPLKKQRSDEFLKAYFGNSWLDKENYKNKLKLSGKA